MAPPPPPLPPPLPPLLLLGAAADDVDPAAAATTDDVDVDARAVAAVSIKPDLKLMSNSERGKYYRRKRKLFAAELETKVARLRRHVRQLAASRQLQSELAPGLQRTPFGSLARLTREYYAQFEFGTPVALLPPESPGAPPVHVAAASPQQVGFLTAAMEERVGFGDFAGIALLLDQWQRYSVYHSDLWFEFKSLDVRVPELLRDEDQDEDDAEPPQPVIEVRADLHVRITRETIEQVFPRLIEERSPLADELTGLEVAYACVNHFYFTREGKIARYDPYVDFLGALASKIRTLAGVAHLLGHARIAKDHMIGVLDDVDDADDARGLDDSEGVCSSDTRKAPATAASVARDDSRVDAVAAHPSSSPSSVDAQADVLRLSSPVGDRLALDFILS